MVAAVGPHVLADLPTVFTCQRWCGRRRRFPCFHRAAAAIATGLFVSNEAGERLAVRPTMSSREGLGRFS